MFDIITFLIIGAAAGFFSGLFGIGGAVIIIPALVFIMDFSQLRAQGTSLVAMLPPVGIFAFMEYYKRGNVDIAAGMLLCISMVIGAAFGAKTANIITASMLKKIFGMFICVIGLRLIFGK